MKTAINTQSQNEVKELLNEYVVFPLNDDISKTLDGMKKEIETLEETTSNKIREVSSGVTGNIDRLKHQLDASFHFEDEEDVFESINNAITDSQEAVIGKIESSVNNSRESVIGEIKSSVGDSRKSVIGEIKSSIDNSQENVIREIKSSVNNTIHDSQEAVIGKMESSQNRITENFSQIESVLTQLQSDLEAAKEQLNSEVKNSKKDFLSEASKHFKQLSELLNSLETASKTSADDTKNELTELNSLLCSKSEALTAFVTEAFEKSDRAVKEIREDILTQLQMTEVHVGVKYDGLSEQISLLAQNISDDFEKQSTVLDNYYMEMNTAIQTTESQQKEIIERKYKTLFTISLSFGITNIIGIIVMIVMFLLK